jgi:hypothetical protein
MNGAPEILVSFDVWATRRMGLLLPMGRRSMASVAFQGHDWVIS